MKQPSKKEIRKKVEESFNKTLDEMNVMTSSKKTKRLIRRAAKRIADQLKSDLKRDLKRKNVDLLKSA